MYLITVNCSLYPRHLYPQSTGTVKSPLQSLGTKKSPPHSMGTKKSPPHSMGIEKNTPLWGVKPLQADYLPNCSLPANFQHS
jgi:hypothetical protein